MHLDIQNATRQLNGALDDETVQTFHTALRGVQAIAPPRDSLFDKEFWNTIKLIQPKLLEIHQMLLDFCALLPQEDVSESATWDNLDNWVQACRQKIDEQSRQAAVVFSTLGVTSYEQLLDSPLTKQVKRDFGPNWQASIEEIKRATGMYGTSASKVRISVAAMDQGLCARIEEIYKYWRSLQEMERTKMLERFNARWSQMSESARRHHLLDRFNYLHDTPDTYVYGIARSSRSSRKSIAAKRFKAPLLNVPELVASENLPNFLKSRVCHHPRLFREIDGNGTFAGLFCASLPELSCENRLTIDHNAIDYGIEWQEHTQLMGINPALFFHQLEAQVKTYCFLHDCVATLDRTSDLTAIRPSSTGEIKFVRPSLLEQMAQIDYAEPLRVDFLYIQNLLKCSLDDTWNDLRELRADPELWTTRLSSTPQEGRCKNLLQSTLSRIEHFSRLDSFVDGLVEEGRSDPTLGSVTIGKFEDYMALEVAFQNVLNGMVPALNIGSWLHRLSSDTLTGLITLLMQEDTMIWAIGHGRALKVIQRELLHDANCRELPTDTMHALHDMSVIAYCLRETQKYRQFVPISQQLRRADLVDKLASKWEGHPRPWQSLASDTIALMDEPLRQKLDVLNARETLDLAKRHEQFWSTIDELMRTASHGKDTREVFDSIQLYAPLGSKLPEKEVEVPHFQTADGFPSQTQVRKSKSRRAEVPDTQSRSVTTESVRTPLPRLSLSVSQALRPDAYNFWQDVSNAGTKTTFRWNDFCTGMSGIGYTLTPQGGSGFRFEYRGGNKSHAIVFHRPHDGKLTPKLARRWLSRMRTHVDLQIF